ncbi:DUF2760 domain-containing protein [Methylococcus sp. EFPC2]|uniref:DUF2760 domain-containing protein n=1 Tax=Methylococcus sp. EFPC2 TaxID=2812648 RepID=UPI0019672B18|nr:DUF2760 domain-containing protein [Methylococcus sp. EFPC2]QSA97179.1 DUF2760 domain-containing protein [Methylococcus sp. EFPC2]
MKFDLSIIPTTYDTVHAALIATVAGLFFLQFLFLLVAWLALRKKCKPAEARLEPAPARPAAAEAPAPVVKTEVRTETVVVKEATPDAALQLLGLLQKEARFVDFIQENIGSYSDAEIGAAARVVHEGCSKVFKQHFELETVRSETEGNRITLPKGFDASAVRLSGNIVGEAPFTGTLVHRGWKVKNITLPKITEGHDVRIVAAAEVEL